MAPEPPSSDNPLAAFGANEWLVEEMFDRYRQDETSVDPSWRRFFADYRPEEMTANGAPATTRDQGTRPADGPTGEQQRQERGAAAPSQAGTKASPTPKDGSAKDEPAKGEPAKDQKAKDEKTKDQKNQPTGAPAKADSTSLSLIHI